MMAAHQQADTVMCTGKDNLRLSRTQTFGSSAAERVSEKDRIVSGLVCRVDPFLQTRAHRRAQIMQAHGQHLHLDRVGRPGEDVVHFPGENLTTD
jgi:lipase chaperone LimK